MTTDSTKPRGESKPKIRLTEARVRDAAPGDYQDEIESSLRLYVSATARTWGVYQWSPAERRPIRRSIGKWPLITVEEARKRAKALSLKLLDGESLSRTDAITLAELVRRYVAWNKTRDLKYPDWIESVIEASYADWLKRDVSTITRAEIADRHLADATRRGRVAAARAVKALRTLFRFAELNELGDGRNPAKAVRVVDSQPRRRFLTPQELARVREALDDPSHASWVKPYVLLAMLTGARRSNLAAARWEHVDLDAGVLHVRAEDSKNREPLAVVLPPEAVTVLKEWRKESTGEWVFPSPKSDSGHLVEPWFAVKRVYEMAGVENATIHDLRRTLGSLLTQAGAPLTTVQRALGHKNPTTTARVYAVSSDESVRAWMSKLNGSAEAPKA